MELRLLVVQGKPLGKEIPITGSRFLIGRSPECHMRPNSELISRVHCQISIEGEEVLLRDMGSSNGTLVNGERLTTEVPLNDGDMVQVGPLGFQVILERAAALAVVMAAAPVAAVAASVPAVPQAIAARPPDKLGSKDAQVDDIHGWLLSDSKNVVPDSGSGVYKGDTQMMDVSAVLKDTQPDAAATTPPEGVKKTEEPADKVVEAEGGIKIKIGSAKQKIEKTRDDTSQAASDILRRMMERRPKR